MCENVLQGEKSRIIVTPSDYFYFFACKMELRPEKSVQIRFFVCPKNALENQQKQDRRLSTLYASLTRTHAHRCAKERCLH